MPSYILCGLIHFLTGGRRSCVTLESILRFVTGCEEEPVLGFAVSPFISFDPSQSGNKFDFMPTASTCANNLKLPRPSSGIELPADEDLYACYDYAFSNTYFGVM